MVEIKSEVIKEQKIWNIPLPAVGKNGMGKSEDEHVRVKGMYYKK